MGGENVLLRRGRRRRGLLGVEVRERRALPERLGVRAFLLEPEDVALREAEHRRRHDVEDVGVVLVEGPRRLVVEGPRVEGELGAAVEAQRRERVLRRLVLDLRQVGRVAVEAVPQDEDVGQQLLALFARLLQRPVLVLRQRAVRQRVLGALGLEAPQRHLGRKRVIQRRFNVAVPRARVPKTDVHGRNRSER